VASVLDHLAIGARGLAGGWELFGGLLGGTWAYGGDSAGFWWGQARVRASGIEPVGVNLAQPGWKEAFLHPRDAHGIVIQVAQQAGPPPSAPPAELPEPGPSSRLDLIEHHVSDLDGAVRLFRSVLDGQLHAANGETAELAWPGGKRIKLVREDSLRSGGALHHVRFAWAAGTFSAADRERASLLAGRLGLTVELAG
jgi:hypothetical protein